MDRFEMVVYLIFKSLPKGSQHARFPSMIMNVVNVRFSFIFIIIIEADTLCILGTEQKQPFETIEYIILCIVL